MALHLNLYHEIQKQKSQSRRDPLKLGMVGVGVIALCLAGYYCIRLREASVVMDRLDQMQALWDKMEPEQKASEAREADLSKSIKTSDALVQKIENRFYWAPLLDQLLEVTPKNVQITNFNGTAVNDNKVTTCSFSITGLSSGKEPRRVAEDLRMALRNKFLENHSNVTASFQMLEDAPETVLLDGKNMPVANFGIKLDMARQEPTQVVDNTPAKRTGTK